MVDFRTFAIKAIVSLTAIWVVVIAIVFSTVIKSSGSITSNMGFGEVAFASPMIIACIAAFVARHPSSRRLLLAFAVAFPAFSMLVFACTFFGDHDAQYQLALLVIPLIGFPVAIWVGIVAFAWSRKGRR